MTKVLIQFIGLYQRLLSPDHSFWAKSRFPHGYCRFYPSCSEYAKQALAKHGLVAGAVKGLFRVIRCNPFVRGGYDPA